MINDNCESYLILRMESEFYAVNVKYTHKVLESSEITQIPNSLPGMKGMINQQGNILPVIDLKETLLNIETKRNDTTCVVVFSSENEDNNIKFGAIVEEAIKVITIKSDDIDPPPSVGDHKQFRHLSGVTRSNDNFVMILDINNIFEDISME